MEKIIDLLKNIFRISIPIIIGYLGILLLLDFVLYLYQIPVKVLILFFRLTWIIAFLIILIKITHYYKLQRNILNETYDELSMSPSEKLLIKQIDQLKNQKKVLYNDYFEKHIQLQEYLELWSHEIKSSLTKIKLDEKDPSLIKDEINQIDYQVSMLLSYERLDNINQGLIYDKFSLNQLINNQVKRLSLLMIAKQLCVEVDIDSNIQYLTDRKWFEVIIKQILLNAIQYTPQNGKIIIVLENNSLKIIDTGIGIANHEISQVFKMGYTGSNGRDNEHATGMGLFLVKKICDAMDIKITLSSKLSKGTCVTLILPSSNIKNNKL